MENKKINKKLEQVKPEKAYNNLDFLHSREGRTVRILSEYLHPLRHFRMHNIRNLIIFFGSARTMSLDQWKIRRGNVKDQLEKAEGQVKMNLEMEMDLLEKRKFLSDIYEETVELARLVTEWSNSLPPDKRFYVASGGGPGMMEAANKGAHEADGLSVGLNISLPFEQYPNQFITPDLNFEFHYFFMRKFWFVYYGKAIIVLPGGYGTLDELMELLTLRQTKKVTKPSPIILYGSEFWKNLINFDYMVEMGVISEADLNLFRYFDEPEQALCNNCKNPLIYCQ